MIRRLEKIKWTALFCLCSLFLVGCDSDPDSAGMEGVYDDVGELDLDLRERLAERTGTFGKDAVQGVRPSESGQQDIEKTASRIYEKPSNSVRKDRARNRARMRSGLRSTPPPQPAPEYWSELQSQQKMNHHPQSVGEMELGY